MIAMTQAEFIGIYPWGNHITAEDRMQEILEELHSVPYLETYADLLPSLLTMDAIAYQSSGSDRTDNTGTSGSPGTANSKSYPLLSSRLKHVLRDEQHNSYRIKVETVSDILADYQLSKQRGQEKRRRDSEHELEQQTQAQAQAEVDINVAEMKSTNEKGIERSQERSQQHQEKFVKADAMTLVEKEIEQEYLEADALKQQQQQQQQQQEQERTKHNPPELTDADALSATMATLCLVHHAQWWNYEWCHRTKVAQFHIAGHENVGYQNTDVGPNPSWKRDPEYSLGTYERSLVVREGGDPTNTSARILKLVDIYTGGQKLDEVNGGNGRRSAEVHIQCCTPNTNAQVSKGWGDDNGDDKGNSGDMSSSRGSKGDYTIDSGYSNLNSGDRIRDSLRLRAREANQRSFLHRRLRKYTSRSSSNNKFRSPSDADAAVVEEDPASLAATKAAADLWSRYHSYTSASSSLEEIFNDQGQQQSNHEDEQQRQEHVKDDEHEHADNSYETESMDMFHNLYSRSMYTEQDVGSAATTSGDGIGDEEGVTGSLWLAEDPETGSVTGSTGMNAQGGSTYDRVNNRHHDNYPDADAANNEEEADVQIVMELELNVNGGGDAAGGGVSYINDVLESIAAANEAAAATEAGAAEDDASQLLHRSREGYMRVRQVLVENTGSGGRRSPGLVVDIIDESDDDDKKEVDGREEGKISEVGGVDRHGAVGAGHGNIDQDADRKRHRPPPPHHYRYRRTEESSARRVMMLVDDYHHDPDTTSTTASTTTTATPSVVGVTASTTTVITTAESQPSIVLPSASSLASKILSLGSRPTSGTVDSPSEPSVTSQLAALQTHAASGSPGRSGASQLAAGVSIKYVKEPSIGQYEIGICHPVLCKVDPRRVGTSASAGTTRNNKLQQQEVHKRSKSQHPSQSQPSQGFHHQQQHLQHQTTQEATTTAHIRGIHLDAATEKHISGSLMALMSTLNAVSPCFNYPPSVTESWWDYSVCFNGQGIRQVHYNKVIVTDTATGIQHERLDPAVEFSLGYPDLQDYHSESGLQARIVQRGAASSSRNMDILSQIPTLRDLTSTPISGGSSSGMKASKQGHINTQGQSSTMFNEVSQPSLRFEFTGGSLCELDLGEDESRGGTAVSSDTSTSTITSTTTTTTSAATATATITDATDNIRPNANTAATAATTTTTTTATSPIIRTVTPSNINIESTPRASTVDLYCGNYDGIISILEDHTCHYNVKISSTLICKYPAFTPAVREVLRLSLEKTL